jgi:hypothetical protein
MQACMLSIFLYFLIQLEHSFFIFSSFIAFLDYYWNVLPVLLLLCLTACIFGNFMLGFWWLWYLSRWLLFAMWTCYCWKHIWNTPNLENSDKFLQDMLFNRIGQIFWRQFCPSKGAVLELVNFLCFFINIFLINFLEEIDIKILNTYLQSHLYSILYYDVSCRYRCLTRVWPFELILATRKLH